MAFSSPGLSKPSQALWNYQYLMLFLSGLIIAAIGYGLLPLLGIEIVESLLSFRFFFTLLFLTLAVAGYLRYLKIVFARPHRLLYFVAIAWPMAEFFKEILFQQWGFNIHLRLLMILLLILPAFWIGIRNASKLFSPLPFLKYFLLFWIWVSIYFFFHNAGAVDPRMPMENVWFGGSIALSQYIPLSTCLAVIILAAITILQHPHPHRFFDRFNITLIVFSGAISLITALGIPFGFFSQEVDGFLRAQGIYLHPNLLAHHMALLLIYEIGLFCYYQGTNKQRMPQWLLIAGILVSLITFLLALSKTGIAVFSGCFALLFLFNLSSPIVRRNFIQVFIGILLLIPCGLMVFQMVTQQSFLEVLQSRIEQTVSFGWRQDVWGALLGNMNQASVLLGNGLTAANAFLFQLSYRNAWNAQPLVLVHNGYIGLLYDLGILGMLLFVSVGSLIYHSGLRLLKAKWRAHNSLLGTAIVLAVYYLAVSGFDEMIYMFDAPILFWMLATLLYSLSIREAA